jgi:hypothetical protein
MLSTVLGTMWIAACVGVSLLAFLAAVRVLDIRVRWWRVIAGLMLLRIANAAMTPVQPYVQQVLANVWGP